MADFEYVSGGHSSGCAWRVYRSKTGTVGKVTRTKRGRNHGEFGKGKTRFFVWALPDSAPEYATYGEALELAEALR